MAERQHWQWLNGFTIMVVGPPLFWLDIDEITVSKATQPTGTIMSQREREKRKFSHFVYTQNSIDVKNDVVLFH